MNTNDTCDNSADAVLLNTGTTGRNPFDKNDPARKYTFCDELNQGELRKFFSKLGLLTFAGLLKVGKKIIIGRTNLAMLDALASLLFFMGYWFERERRPRFLLRPDSSAPEGFTIDKEVAEKFRNAITLVSTSTGKIANPRVSFGTGWRQDKPAFGISKHLHALFLHEHGQYVGKTWSVIVKAAVAHE